MTQRRLNAHQAFPATASKPRRASTHARRPPAPAGRGEGGQEIHRKPLKTLDSEKEMKGNANVGRVIRRSDSAPARRRKVLQITMAGVWA